MKSREANEYEVEGRRLCKDRNTLYHERERDTKMEEQQEREKWKGSVRKEQNGSWEDREGIGYGEIV